MLLVWLVWEECFLLLDDYTRACPSSQDIPLDVVSKIICGLQDHTIMVQERVNTTEEVSTCISSTMQQNDTAFFYRRGIGSFIAPLL